MSCCEQRAQSGDRAVSAQRRASCPAEGLARGEGAAPPPASAVGLSSVCGGRWRVWEGGGGSQDAEASRLPRRPWQVPLCPASPFSSLCSGSCPRPSSPSPTLWPRLWPPRPPSSPRCRRCTSSSRSRQRPSPAWPVWPPPARTPSLGRPWSPRQLCWPLLRQSCKRMASTARSKVSGGATVGCFPRPSQRPGARPAPATCRLHGNRQVSVGHLWGPGVSRLLF